MPFIPLPDQKALPRDALHPPPALGCIVLGGEVDAESLALVTGMLERSARIGRIEHVADEIALSRELMMNELDLAVIVLRSPDDLLPTCLLKRPSLRTLVVAPDGVSGTLGRWLQQGATDLVSPHDEDALAHSLSRLVDECVLAGIVRRQQTIIETQTRRIAALTRRVRTLDEARTPDHPTDAFTPGDDVRSVAGLPGRRATLRRLERDERLTLAGTITALQITLPGNPGQWRTDAGGLERTLADLAVYRAAEALRDAFPDRLLLGRTRRDTLLLLGAGGDTRVRARALRDRLGTLGGLVDHAGEIRIDSLTGQAMSIATPDLVERLEQRAHRTPANPTAVQASRRRQSDNQATPLDDSLVPVLTQRCVGARSVRRVAGA